MIGYRTENDEPKAKPKTNQKQGSPPKKFMTKFILNGKKS